MRIGLVGFGHGGRFFHAPLIASLPGVTFAGVVTRSPERRQLLANEYPGVNAYDSLGQLVEAGVDLLVISTTLQGRPQLVKQAIELGVPVVSDKPFAADTAQARQLVEAAQRRGVLLSVYQNRRWDSDFLTVRKLLDAGALGQVARFESFVERFSPGAVGDASGGGWMRDLGSHLVDQALQLFGPVQSVYAERTCSPQHPDIDHSFFMALTHANGVISHLGGSCLQSSPRPRFRVSGTLGCYSVEGFDGQEAAVLAGLSPKTEGDRWGAEEHRRWGWFEQGDERERVPTEHGRWQQFYLQMIAAVKGQGAVPVDPCDVLQALQVLDAARLSAERQQVIRVDLKA
ncbi:Gfo/Idh/MocA family protein [Pseudomonas deceptionensis]|uniref:Predicted dehydrogenase n=1 Tax=Pseudomonas deceptionensis TaxID=882211 RepID=A0A0J6GFZ9_PSEDM|nr:Gfo/Idh/MocA family oxidoreductase [Pseudomonas deceptionensis]KMM80874.1 oxidoreductase [Pseudomonas deceptionensis]SEE88948.1 Predicted dehydrogenase [Pseudomonas deceptionensis]